MTTPDDIALPPLQPHDHPEPHTMRWTELEMEAIRAFARAVVQQAKAHALDELRALTGRVPPKVLGGAC